MMSGRIGLCFVGCVAAALAAAAQTGMPPVQTMGQFRIAGTVVNASTGKPVMRASVELLSTDNYRMVAATVTDNDGRFSFERLVAGKYPLSASKRGYRTAFYDEHEGFNSAIVTGPDQDTEHLIFLLWPGAEVHGVVTADGGDPVEAAQVILFKRTSHRAPGEEMSEAGSTQTDDTGTYEFRNLAPGEYTIAVTAQPWYATRLPHGKQADENSASLDVAYPVTFYDSTTDEASASVLKLTEGEREEADINLHAVPALHISVATPTHTGGRFAPLQLRQFIFGREVPFQIFATFNDLASGLREFDFEGVAPGHYQMTQGDPPRTAELDATSNEQIDPEAGVPSVAVRGRLQSAGGAASVRMRVILTPVNGTHGQTAVATADEDGHFSFDAVAPGSWSLSAVTANGQTLLPVRAIISGSSVHEGNLLTVSDHPLDIVATIGTKVTRIEGFARKDGKGFAGAVVLLVPRDMAEFDVLSRRDQTDSDGSFSLPQVPPGKYTLIAVEGGWDLDFSQRAVLARYLPRGTPVIVTDASDDVMHFPGPVEVQPR